MVPDDAPFQIIHDCDPGIDDALALAVLARAGRDDRARLAAVVAVGGNVGLDHTAANVGFLTDRFDLRVPTYAGASLPLAGAVPGDAAQVHGDDGIGGLRSESGWVEPPLVLASDLVDLVLDLDPGAGPRVLLATGPLTNLAAMVQIEPNLGRFLDRVVVMGGAFGDPGGNVTEQAEFNAWVDPEAWHVVAGAGLHLEVVPLDVTTRVVMDRDDVAKLRGTDDADTLVSELVRVGIDLYDALLGTPTCEMHDPLAAALVFEPSLVEWSYGSVTVELDGDARGQTVFTPDLSGPTRVALGIDAAAAHAWLLDTLALVDDR